MFHKLLLVACFVDFCLDLNSAKLLQKIVIKRSDIDLQTCINNFAVHKDKIIRTQDSRAMGAKYLNEIDLDTREECLRLCCETENCDVFVYEEKNVGSCYLFQCGPPKDFKCKFTHHVNYSSGVLTINRHLPDLESQIKLTKHEQDLSKLREPFVGASANPELLVAKTTPSTTATTIKSKEISIISANAKTPSGSGRCSRFQFECRSNSECIAIYNACDGIPQCTDGSDEASELGCPATTTLPPVPSPLPIHHNPSIYDSTESHPSRANQNSNVQISNLYLSPLQHQTSAQTATRQDADFIRPVAEPRNTLFAQGHRYDNSQVPQYSQFVPQSQNWISHQSNQMPSQMDRYSDKNSHIFNHKEVGLQVPDGQDTRKDQIGNISPHEYPKVPNYYEDVYQQSLQDNWQEHLPVPNGGEQSYKAIQDINPNWKLDEGEENPTHLQNKMAHELKYSKEHFEEPTENKQNKIEKHVRSEHNHDHSKYSISEIAEKLELQDGVAETPGGAILSLTLGLIITCLMAILIGCRLRVVRRRMRRGGKSYAHDADYLVNGMYL